MSAAGKGQARLNTYHGAKKALLGNQAGHAAPAWRSQNIPAGVTAARKASGAQKGPTPSGSKVLLSNLPRDVKEEEVEDLFKKTVGPIKSVFIIYNSQATSKGMAVAEFHRATDAALAREKYHGKIVDGRTPLKIEIVVDDIVRPPTSKPAAAAGPPSLLSRLGGTNGKSKAAANASLQGRVASVGAVPMSKKGPKRVKKSVAQLDQEMEDYRAAITPFSG